VQLRARKSQVNFSLYTFSVLKAALFLKDIVDRNHCIPSYASLYCTPASLSASCPSTQCSDSNVLLGNASTHATSAGCNVSSCSYGGFVNGTIETL
jgi:hypothetical protein